MITPTGTSVPAGTEAPNGGDRVRMSLPRDGGDPTDFLLAPRDFPNHLARITYRGGLIGLLNAIWAGIRPLRLGARGNVHVSSLLTGYFRIVWNEVPSAQLVDPCDA